MILCYTCRQEKAEEEFYKTRLQGVRNRFSGNCKECAKTYAKSWWDTAVESSRARYDKNKNCAKTRLRLLIKSGSKKHDRKDLDWDWSWNKLQSQNFKCEISGHPFEYEARSPYGLSIDRIDNAKGYTKDNVRFICWWLNAAMGNWGLEKLKELVKEWQN